MLFFCMITAYLLLYFNVKNIVNINRNEAEVAYGNGVVYAYTTCIYCLYIYILTEMFSLFTSVNFLALSVMWGGFLVFNIGVMIKGKTYVGCQVKGKTFYIFLIYSFAVIGLSYVTPLYNWDSMCFHLPRIVQWEGQCSISHFATTDTRQLDEPVFSEYILLHIYILSGKVEKFLSLPQAFSFLSSGFMVYNLAKMIGCRNIFALLSGFLFLSMPIAFAEALTTQNDNITTFIFLCFLSVVVDIIINRRYLCKNIGYYGQFIFVGLLSGLAILTKHYTIIPCFFVFVWILFVYIKNEVCKARIILSALVIITSVSFVLLPEYARQYFTFGTLVNDEISSSQVIKSVDVRVYLVGFLKNFCYNLTNNYIYRINDIIILFMESIIDYIGLDKNGQWIELSFYRRSLNGAFVYHHDTASNPIIVWLLMVTGVIMLVKLRLKHIPNIGYVLTSTASFVVFLTIMRYTHFRTRYEIVFFAFILPAMCYVLDKFVGESIKRKYYIIAIVCLLSLVEMFNMFIYHFNIARLGDWGGRAGYFVLRKIGDVYEQIDSNLKKYNCKSMGINVASEIWEYPLWTLTSAEDIKVIGVENASAKYEDSLWEPDCIVYMNFEEKYTVGDSMEYHGVLYKFVESNNESGQKYQFAIRTDRISQ